MSICSDKVELRLELFLVKLHSELYLPKLVPAS